MGLQAAFEKALGSPHPLVELDGLIWQSLSAGSRSSRHPWTCGQLTTIDASGFPHSRTVVLRAADRVQLTVDCHTDRRSEKCRDLGSAERGGPVSWVFWESSSKIQLRLEGWANVLTEGREWEDAWVGTPLRSRSAYVSLDPPGRETDTVLPPDVSDREVDQDESERGREFFAIVRTQVQRLDWLYLRRGGHVRASIDYPPDGDCRVRWLVP